MVEVSGLLGQLLTDMYMYWFLASLTPVNYI